MLGVAARSATQMNADVMNADVETFRQNVCTPERLYLFFGVWENLLKFWELRFY
ncbi:hypothetical protein NG798_07490 [Ancylothrix sp. C2]|nr:hypothetical protein [Ancylothrix sp. D3o]